MPSMNLSFESRQQHTLSPRLQRAVRLLQLSSLDFAQELQETLSKNPFLEAEESVSLGEESMGEMPEADAASSESSSQFAEIPSNELSDAQLLNSGIDGLFEGSFQDEYLISNPQLKDDAAEYVESNAIDYTENAAIEKSTDQVTEFISEDFDQNERDSWQADLLSGGARSFDGEASVMDMQAVHVSLTDHLHSQLNLLPLDEKELLLSHAIVESLDDDGYLRCELDEITALAGDDFSNDDEAVLIALKRVQSLDPIGIAARNVGECLALQLPRIKCEIERELARQIITEHIDRLAAKDVEGIAKRLHRNVKVVEAVCDRIRGFEPRPGSHFNEVQVHYIVPDVIVKKVRGNWTVTLNSSVVPKVRLNHIYAEMFQRHRSAENAELATHLQEARWTLSNVEQRFATILSVAEAIVKRQKHFFEYGAMGMKPLGLREIAEEVGMHESTVSRVTNNKFMATPLGVFELKYFFSRSMQTASGGECSATAIRSLIQDMIASESAIEPLSDAEIARKLAQQGVVVARRTVTKYRQLLRIEAVERRRRH